MLTGKCLLETDLLQLPNFWKRSREDGYVQQKSGCFSKIGKGNMV